MKTHRLDLTVTAGATFYYPFAIDFTDGTTADPPTIGDGYTIGRATIRDEIGGDAILELTTDNGGVVLGLFTDADGVQWSGYLFASAASTSALVEWGDGIWALEISDGLHVERVMEGVAVLSPEVVT